MTLSGDFIPAEDGLYDEPSNPVVFGVEITPKILGILLAIAGVGLAIFLFQRFIQPVRETNRTLREDIALKERGRTIVPKRTAASHPGRRAQKNRGARRPARSSPDSASEYLLSICRRILHGYAAARSKPAH